MIGAPAEIVTPRLRLRRWLDSDMAPFAALNADPRVMAHYPRTLDRGESDALAGRIRAHFVEHGFGLWALEVLGSSSFIGYVGLARPRFEAAFTPCVEIGWRLAFEHWGKRYATEGARAALSHAFGPLGLDAVVSFTSVGNDRSRRLMQRLGMRRDPAEDFEHPNLPIGHRLRPHVLYRLARDEWSSGRPEV